MSQYSFKAREALQGLFQCEFVRERANATLIKGQARDSDDRQNICHAASRQITVTDGYPSPTPLPQGARDYCQRAGFREGHIAIRPYIR